jgi:hypothetical protein
VSRLALIVLAAAVSFALAGGAQAAPPSLYASYSPSCTFTWTGDNKAAVTAVPPGTYDVVITTPFAFGNGLASCLYVQFHLTGPGVDLDTDLGQGDAEIEQLTVTLQPNATYTVQDDGRPALTRKTFTTAASGTASSGGSTSTGSGSSSTGKVTGTPSVDIAGSDVLAFRGALDAIVWKSGRLTLAKAGKPVTALPAGRYTFAVDDESKTTGFTVQRGERRPVTLTTRTFVGNHSDTLVLVAGRWFFSTPGGPKHAFTVRG